jgi:hypothetical protein
MTSRICTLCTLYVLNITECHLAMRRTKYGWDDTPRMIPGSMLSEKSQSQGHTLYD